jgi:hypothetical protein
MSSLHHQKSISFTHTHTSLIQDEIILRLFMQSEILFLFLPGYRPLQNVKGCLNSLFYMHNETINILTHGNYVVSIYITLIIVIISSVNNLRACLDIFFPFSLILGIPIIYILAIVPPYLPWEDSFRFLSWCHLIGAVSPWCGR